MPCQNQGMRDNDMTEIHKIHYSDYPGYWTAKTSAGRLVICKGLITGIILSVLLSFLTVPFFGAGTVFADAAFILCPVIYTYGCLYVTCLSPESLLYVRGNGKTTATVIPVLPVVKNRKGEGISAVVSMKWRLTALLSSVIGWIIILALGLVLVSVTCFIGGGLMGLIPKTGDGFIEGGVSALRSIYLFILGGDGMKVFFASLFSMILLMTLLFGLGFLIGRWRFAGKRVPYRNADGRTDKTASSVFLLLMIAAYIAACAAGLVTGEIQDHAADHVELYRSVFDFLTGILH